MQAAEAGDGDTLDVTGVTQPGAPRTSGAD
jgi:hypothetical protein